MSELSTPSNSSFQQPTSTLGTHSTSSFPDSIPAQSPFHSKNMFSSSFLPPSDHHEQKFKPSFQPNFNFGTPKPSSPFPDTPTSQWNSHTPTTPLPTFVKQEDLQSSCEYSRQDRYGRSMGVSSSVIILDDNNPTHFPNSSTHFPNSVETKKEPHLPELTREDLTILDLMDDEHYVGQPLQYAYPQSSLR